MEDISGILHIHNLTGMALANQEAELKRLRNQVQTLLEEKAALAAKAAENDETPEDPHQADVDSSSSRCSSEQNPKGNDSSASGDPHQPQ